MVTLLIAAIALLGAVLCCALIAPPERDSAQPEWGLDIAPSGPSHHELGAGPATLNSDE
jgi:hypothetical protein